VVVGVGLALQAVVSCPTRFVVYASLMAHNMLSVACAREAPGGLGRSSSGLTLKPCGLRTIVVLAPWIVACPEVTAHFLVLDTLPEGHRFRRSMGHCSVVLARDSGFKHCRQAPPP
jgi:hypothetical protein